MPTQQQNTMTASDFNLQKLSTKELSEHVYNSIQIGGNISVFGRRGTGKTEISKYQIQKSGMNEVYINLSVLERVDMGGYPNIMAAQLQKKFVDFLLPQFYAPMMEGQQGVVALLDEVDKADPSLWAPLLEFVQYRSINHQELPNLHAIIMTGNLISEGGSRPSLPLLDRSEKYLVESDATSWLQWAGKQGHIHPSITAFIYDNPNELLGAVDPGERYADPSPRGWDRASQIIFQGEKLGWNSELLNKKVSGCVGKSAGIKYQIYFDHYQKLLPLVDNIYKNQNIINDYMSLDPTKKLVVCMMACARFATLMDQSKPEEPPPSIKSVGKFLQNVSPEHMLVAVRSQIQIDRIVSFNLDEHVDWAPFINDVAKKVDM